MPAEALGFTDIVFVTSIVFLVFVKCDNLTTNTTQSSSPNYAGHRKFANIKKIEDTDKVVELNHKEHLIPLMHNISDSDSAEKLFNSLLPKSSNKENNEFLLKSEQTDATLQTSPFNQVGTAVSPDVIDNEPHYKMSKGRKGVTNPVSSVVARKGVPLKEEQLITLEPVLPVAPKAGFHSSMSELNNNNKLQLTQLPLKSSETQTVKLIENLHQDKINHTSKNHTKKPEYVFDEQESDDSDKYSLIGLHSSTTGEDYVIIGIVIVIGIWFSVFGALIFYRRAGEYWDRRHYRRMDFLVEGMYND